MNIYISIEIVFFFSLLGPFTQARLALMGESLVLLDNAKTVLPVSAVQAVGDSCFGLPPFVAVGSGVVPVTTTEKMSWYIEKLSINAMS